MRAPVKLAAVVAAACLWGCAPSGSVRLPERKVIAVTPLAERLVTYNAELPAIRAQGRLELSGKGSADFGARAAEQKGFRLDAVRGPFSAPLVAIACRVGTECQVYVPSRNTVYLGRDEGWGAWFEALLRGRVPRMGAPEEAWYDPARGNVLVLAGSSGWRQEVEFDPLSFLPACATFFRGSEPAAEVRYGEYFLVAGHPFPCRLTVRVREPAWEYEIVYRAVEPDSGPLEGAFHLSLPSEIAVETVRESAQWNRTGIPLWLPIPDE